MIRVLRKTTCRSASSSLFGDTYNCCNSKLSYRFVQEQSCFGRVLQDQLGLCCYICNNEYVDSVRLLVGLRVTSGSIRICHRERRQQYNIQALLSLRLKVEFLHYYLGFFCAQATHEVKQEESFSGVIHKVRMCQVNFRLELQSTCSRGCGGGETIRDIRTAFVASTLYIFSLNTSLISSSVS